MININGKTKLLGVIGDPIEHTLSPVIHNTLSELLGINAVYMPIHVRKAENVPGASDRNDIDNANKANKASDSEPMCTNIENAIKGAASMSFSGLNITVPYKTDVINSLVDIDDTARKIGAVNTLVPVEGGFKGYNTDMPGLYRALSKQGVNLENKEAVVIGAGGAARAVCMMLVTFGAAKVYLVNRSIEKAEEVAKLSDKIIPLKLSDYKTIPDGKYIMLQCTSLGLKEGDGLVINDDDFYKMAEFGYDLIYNPPETPFIKKMKQLNVPYDNGLSMLLYQAVIAYEYWFDLSVSEEVVEEVRKKLSCAVYGNSCINDISNVTYDIENNNFKSSEDLKNKINNLKDNQDVIAVKKNIVLTGYMGSGKSTVGKRLAEKLGMSFIDTDEEIVRREGRSINEIFSDVGEEGFRKIETEVLSSLAKENATNTEGTVFATGGGIVTRKENMSLLKELGKVFYLKADEETTFNRVKDDSSRPLLSSESLEELRLKIRNMLRERKGYYELTADIIINTSGRTVEDIVEEIAK